ncbi:hypothetical protein HYH39_15935 [Clostridium botulinum]|uniref:hypothetical protein n=1 Tax=unclassified Clostridium TaxID=2614128 RepID=UPI000B269F5C|nr:MULTISPECIES: hypothetical protein [unclassified Clostridium]MBY6780451.1 hypothetical protein [Clostridium botulinum]MBY6853600.1 hypothetical protein [Clostridium botulinum]MBY7009172.1 hypothetical protein [Clostridium botulinum]
MHNRVKSIGCKNKVYTTEGAMACINYAFKSLKLEKLMATVEIETINNCFKYHIIQR